MHKTQHNVLKDVCYQDRPPGFIPPPTPPTEALHTVRCCTNTASVCVHVAAWQYSASWPGCRMGLRYNWLWQHFIWRLLCGIKIDAIFLHLYSLTRDSMPSPRWVCLSFLVRTSVLKLVEAISTQFTSATFPLHLTHSTSRLYSLLVAVLGFPLRMAGGSKSAENRVYETEPAFKRRGFTMKMTHSL